MYGQIIGRCACVCMCVYVVYIYIYTCTYICSVLGDLTVTRDRKREENCTGDTSGEMERRSSAMTIGCHRLTL